MLVFHFLQSSQYLSIHWWIIEICHNLFVLFYYMPLIINYCSSITFNGFLYLSMEVFIFFQDKANQVFAPVRAQYGLVFASKKQNMASVSFSKPTRSQFTLTSAYFCCPSNFVITKHCQNTRAYVINLSSTSLCFIYLYSL